MQLSVSSGAGAAGVPVPAVDAASEYGKQLPHEGEFHITQCRAGSPGFQLIDADAQLFLMVVQLFNPAFHMGRGGTVAEVRQGIYQCAYSAFDFCLLPA
mgnify:CR=1 FL=1